MKAILVIDMPSDCIGCNQYRMGACQTTNRILEYQEIRLLERPSWCPLRELPEKYSQDHLSSFGGDYYTGYNHCLEDILGEENESTNNR